MTKVDELEQLYSRSCHCVRCPLGLTRNQFVFGVGSAAAQVVFIGEAPGHDEDQSGIPFCGRAGEVLHNLIDNEMKLKPEQYYIANICKCRPEENGKDRKPTMEEMTACGKYVEQQIEIIEPKVIVTLGNTPSHYILRDYRGGSKGISQLRGVFAEWQGIQVMPTYHPSYLLRNGCKGDPWTDTLEDLDQVMDVVRRAE